MAVSTVVPTCNLDTVKDGRGGIFTYYPVDAPVVEWNLIVTNAGTSRGFHYHPEFVEYVLVVAGHGVYVTRDEHQQVSYVKVSIGDCVHFPIGTHHTLHAISDMRMVALLTKRWDDCAQPLVRVD